MQIIELGIASQLTLGREKGWFEWGRPGHGGRLHHQHNHKKRNLMKNNIIIISEVVAQIIEIGNAAELTLGQRSSGHEIGRPGTRA